MKPPKLFRSKHNIAVVGLYRSGKSVFITSFINHVLHHRPEDLSIEEGNVQLTFDEELSQDAGFARFPYEEYRHENNGRWPQKTKTLLQYRCSFYRNDWKWSKGQLSLIDIPGERMADIPMSKFSYIKWSDWLLNRVFRDKHYIDLSQGYRSVIEREGVVESDIILAYRNLLVELYKSYRPVITPSTFILQNDGTSHGKSLMNGDITGALVGLSEDEQFAPLTASVRQKDMALANLFASRYEKYRRQIAVPLTDTLSRCNELAILVDVTTLLAANTGMYNGNRELLDQFFQILSPGKGFFGVGMGLLRSTFGGHWERSGISKIAIVATKADKVYENQRDKLRDLIKEMTGRIVRKYEHKSLQLDCKFFECSAVKSTVFTDDGLLRGHLKGHKEKSDYRASDLPDKWPKNWSEGEYLFPDVKPDFPENDTIPPSHIGLDNVLGFLLKMQR